MNLPTLARKNNLLLVANSKRKVNVLSLTDSSERTLYTLSGIRWGKYIDMEGRLDSYWYWGFEAIKRKAAYVMANFRGEIDEMRNIQLNFGEPLSQAQAKENAETDAWRTQREKSMKVNIKSPSTQLIAVHFSDHPLVKDFSVSRVLLHPLHQAHFRKKPIK